MPSAPNPPSVPPDAANKFIAAFADMANGFFEVGLPRGVELIMHCSNDLVDVELRLQGQILLAHEYRKPA